jgi:hypothetical protein
LQLDVQANESIPDEALLQVSQIQQLNSVTQAPSEFRHLRSYLDRVEDSVRNIGNQDHPG